MIGMVPNGWHTLEDLAHDVGCSYDYATRHYSYAWTHADPGARLIIPPGESIELGYVYLPPSAYERLLTELRSPTQPPRYSDRDRHSALVFVRMWAKEMDVLREPLRGLEPLP